MYDSISIAILLGISLIYFENNYLKLALVSLFALSALSYVFDFFSKNQRIKNQLQDLKSKELKVQLKPREQPKHEPSKLLSQSPVKTIRQFRSQNFQSPSSSPASAKIIPQVEIVKKPLDFQLSLTQKFQNALKPLLPLEKEIIEDGIVFKDSDATAKLTHLDFDSLSEKMKQWVSEHVLKKLAQRINDVDQELEKLGWDHLKCSACTYQESLNGTLVKTFTQTGNTQTPSNLLELQKLYPQERIVQERLQLEKHLTFEYNCRNYIVDRIKELAKGHMIASFKWNSGGKKWDSQGFPSDSLLVLNLVLKFMDELFIPSRGFNFTQKYFIDCSTSVSF